MELYQQGNLDAAATANAMHHVEAEVGRMRLLVDELGLLARLDAGRPIEHDTLDLTALARSVVEDAQIVYPDRSITLDTPQPVTATGDTARVQQVFRNLVGNAVQHTPTSASVRVSLRTTGGSAEFAVADDGPGIPAADLPRIFERFWRAEASRSRLYGGSGLGLAIVDAIVQAHHGQVTSIRRSEPAPRSPSDCPSAAQSLSR